MHDNQGKWRTVVQTCVTYDNHIFDLKILQERIMHKLLRGRKYFFKNCESCCIDGSVMGFPSGLAGGMAISLMCFTSN